MTPAAARTRRTRTQHSLQFGIALLAMIFVLVCFNCVVLAQETTAGIQGTVKDPSGAVISDATVEVSGPALIGIKKIQTDQGYFRFANLPSGTYTLTVTVSGFRTYKQEN